MMVARDPVTKTAYPVNRLVANSVEEESILTRGKERKHLRKVMFP